MTYDSWKTTDPREYEYHKEDEPTELDIVYDQLYEAHRAARSDKEIATKRIEELTASLAECLEYFRDRYDIRDGENGPLPNKEMQMGTMIEETLYGIRF